MSEKIKGEKLECVPCIWYLVNFKDQTEALLDSESKVNITSQAFAYQFGLNIWKTNIGAQKIEDTTPETYEMVFSTFSVLDKDNRERLFEKSFLLADIKLDVVLGISFLTMTNVYIDFQARDL